MQQSKTHGNNTTAPSMFPVCSTTPRFLWALGTFGNFGISASLVVQLRAILTEPSVSWKYELLYVPFLIPFALASVVTVVVHRRDLEVPWWTPFREAFQRVAGEAANESVVWVCWVALVWAKGGGGGHLMLHVAAHGTGWGVGGCQLEVRPVF